MDKNQKDKQNQNNPSNQQTQTGQKNQENFRKGNNPSQNPSSKIGSYGQTESEIESDDLEMDYDYKTPQGGGRNTNQVGNQSTHQNSNKTPNKDRNQGVEQGG